MKNLCVIRAGSWGVKLERSTSARFLHLGPIVVCWTK